MLSNALLATLLCLPSTLATSYGLKRAATVEHDLDWARQAKADLLGKYNAEIPSSSTGQKRQAAKGSGQLTNYRRDVAYYIPAQFGTPPKSYNILLDTGSSDMWLASTSCTVGCSDLVNLYAPGQGSSTYNATGSQPFSITYVGGTIQGTTAADTVSLVGLTVPAQPFGVITILQGSAFPPNVTGLMGLGFSRLAQIAIPWWQRSAQLTPWAEPLFAFSLTRQNTNPTAGLDSPGGSFSIGQLDSTAYQGAIDYINIPPGLESWWLIPVLQIGINGQTYSITSGGGASLAAIDTATSLIGGPPAVVRQIYAQIPGSRPGTGADAGYWFYPCSQNVVISFNFGGRTWPMAPTDFPLATTQPGTCVGAIFEVSFSGTGPQWVIGDAFLKNVYSVFRYNPPSVGFAAVPGSSVVIPTATASGSISASAATGTGGTLFPFTTLPGGGLPTDASTTTRAAGLGAAPGLRIDTWLWCSVVPLVMAVMFVRL